MRLAFLLDRLHGGGVQKLWPALPGVLAAAALARLAGPFSSRYPRAAFPILPTLREAADPWAWQ
jgi:hypothetical protein